MALKKPEKIYQTDEETALKTVESILEDKQEINPDNESVSENIKLEEAHRWTDEDENSLEKIKHKISEVTKKIEEKGRELLLRSNLKEKTKTTGVEKNEVNAKELLLEEVKETLLGLIDGKKIKKIESINIEKTSTEQNIFIKAKVIVNTKLPNKSFEINIELSNKDIRIGKKDGGADEIEQNVDVKNYSVKGSNILAEGIFGPKQSVEFALEQKFKNFYTDIKNYIEKNIDKNIKNIKIENGELNVSFEGEIEQDTLNIEVEKLDTLLKEKEELESTLEKLNNNLSELNQKKINLEEDINQDIEISPKNEEVLTVKNISRIKHAIFNLSPERKENILKTEDKTFKDPNVWEKLKKLINLPNNQIIILIENWEEWTKMSEGKNLELGGTRLLTTLAEAMDIKLSDEKIEPAD